MCCPDESKIDVAIAELKSNCILTDEGDLSTYLGIEVKMRNQERKNGNGLAENSLPQPFLIHRIIGVLGLSDSRQHTTPAESNNLLHKDEEGPVRTDHWSFQSVIGMLNYLCGTRLDILFAVHQCARFCEYSRLSYEKAVKHILQYLKNTPNEGVVPRPNSSQGIQHYVDADFADSWNSTDSDDPSSVYSCTGYVIIYAGCPIVWVSKL